MAGRDHFKSSYGSYSTQQRELERSRARRDAADAAADAEAARIADETAGGGAAPDAEATPDDADAEQPTTPATP